MATDLFSTWRYLDGVLVRKWRVERSVANPRGVQEGLTDREN